MAKRYRFVHSVSDRRCTPVRCRASFIPHEDTSGDVYFVSDVEAELATLRESDRQKGEELDTLRAESMQSLYREQCEHAKTRVKIAELEAIQDGSSLSKLVIEWCHQAGWATGHGDTVLDILNEMRSQHCEERSERDRVATNMEGRVTELESALARAEGAA